MVAGTLILAGLALALAALLVAAAAYLGPLDSERDLSRRVEALLPRIHCGQCGYPGCAAYADALVSKGAPINRCPPGGEQTMRRLALLLGQPLGALDKSLGAADMNHVARIREPSCIGCNLCVRACPVDSIVGVAQAMHTVIAAHCTGCELCLQACPVDCIELIERNV
jgi:electron transport complex protein RnfB